MSFPHISSEQGMILPVKELCSLARENGILSVIDGAQATGHIPIDVREIGCDAYYSSPHKWLMAPAGNGFLYVKETLIDEVWTTLASTQWNNHEDNGYRLGQRGTPPCSRDSRRPWTSTSRSARRESTGGSRSWGTAYAGA